MALIFPFFYSAVCVDVPKSLGKSRSMWVKKEENPVSFFYVDYSLITWMEK